jgi:hypothetical protein
LTAWQGYRFEFGMHLRQNLFREQGINLAKRSREGLATRYSEPFGAFVSELLDEIEKNPIDTSAYGIFPATEAGDVLPGTERL